MTFNDFQRFNRVCIEHCLDAISEVPVKTRIQEGHDIASVTIDDGLHVKATSKYFIDLAISDFGQHSSYIYPSFYKLRDNMGWKVTRIRGFTKRVFTIDLSIQQIDIYRDMRI